MIMDQSTDRPMDEIVNIELSRDKMLGVIWFQKEQDGGKGLSAEKIKYSIGEKGITAGIDTNLLENILNKREYDYKYIIAKGTQPTPGEDASIELKFDAKTLKDFKPALREDGTADFRNLNAVKNVRAGEILAVKIPSKKGVDGYNVLGQTIKYKKGKDVRIPKGRNTKVLEDRLTLVAAIDGKLEYDEHNVYINSVYTLNSDLDNSVGNINFIGDVVINGSVNSGFEIKAGGNVEVRGPVEDAIIEADGNVVLSYGMQGTNRSKIVAKGNVMAKFLQNVTVEAGGDIIAEAILHSNVTSGGKVKCDTGKGTIVGGSVSATNFIEANSIGSPMGTVTHVQIGVSPLIYKEHRELGERIKQLLESLDKIDKSVKFLSEKKIKGELDAAKNDMFDKLILSRVPITDEYEELRYKNEKLEEKLNNVSDGIVKVNKNLYPGVKLEIGNCIKYVDDPYYKSVIRKEDGDVRIGI